MTSMFEFLDDSGDLAFKSKVAGKAIVQAKHEVLKHAGDFLFLAHTDNEFALRCRMIDGDLDKVAYSKMASVSDSKSKLVRALYDEWQLRHAKCETCKVAAPAYGPEGPDGGRQKPTRMVFERKPNYDYEGKIVSYTHSIHTTDENGHNSLYEEVCSGEGCKHCAKATKLRGASRKVAVVKEALPYHPSRFQCDDCGRYANPHDNLSNWFPHPITFPDSSVDPSSGVEGIRSKQEKYENSGIWKVDHPEQIEYSISGGGGGGEDDYADHLDELRESPILCPTCVNKRIKGHNASRRESMALPENKYWDVRDYPNVSKKHNLAVGDAVTFGGTKGTSGRMTDRWVGLVMGVHPHRNEVHVNWINQKGVGVSQIHDATAVGDLAVQKVEDPTLAGQIRDAWVKSKAKLKSMGDTIRDYRFRKDVRDFPEGKREHDLKEGDIVTFRRDLQKGENPTAWLGKVWSTNPHTNDVAIDWVGGNGRVISSSDNANTVQKVEHPDAVAAYEANYAKSQPKAK